MFDFIFTIAIILVALFVAFIAINNIFTFIYLFIDYNLSRLKDKELYPTISGLHFIKQCFIEGYYVFGKFYLYPYKFVNLTLPPEPIQHKYAVLLIHGYGRTQTDWIWFRKQLNDLQVPIYTVNLAPAFAAIEQITIDSLPNKIAQIKQQTNCEKIILVGHSMGGLVATYYKEFFDDEKLIDAVMCITSPFKGTKLSIAATGENSKQMLPNSHFTNKLRMKIALNPNNYYFIATKFDNIVFPWQSELLDGVPQEQQLILGEVSHLSTLHYKVVAQQINVWIKKRLV